MPDGRTSFYPFAFAHLAFRFVGTHPNILSTALAAHLNRDYPTTHPRPLLAVVLANVSNLDDFLIQSIDRQPSTTDNRVSTRTDS